MKEEEMMHLAAPRMPQLLAAVITVVLSMPLALLPATAQTGSEALIYIGNGGLGAPGEWAYLEDVLESACVSEATITDVWPADLGSYSFIFIDFPQSIFSADQKAALLQFRDACGRILLAGDNGAGYSVAPTNDLATSLGLGSALLALQHDNGCVPASVPVGASHCAVTAVLDPNTLTTGEISAGASATALLEGVDGEILLVTEAGVFLGADLNLFTGLSCALNASNEQLVRNICSCPPEEAPVCAPSKVLVCHVPPEDPANQHPICVNSSAVSAHLGHGDHLGDCCP